MSAIKKQLYFSRRTPSLLSRHSDGNGEGGGGGATAVAAAYCLPLPSSQIRMGGRRQQWHGRGCSGAVVAFFPPLPSLSDANERRSPMVARQRERQRDGREAGGGRGMGGDDRCVALTTIAHPRRLQQPAMSSEMTTSVDFACYFIWMCCCLHVGKMLKMQWEIDVVILDDDLKVDWIWI